MKKSRLVVTALVLIIVVGLLALTVAPAALALQTSTATPTATAAATAAATTAATGSPTAEATSAVTETVVPTATAAATTTAEPTATVVPTATEPVTTTTAPAVSGGLATITGLQDALQSVYERTNPSVVSIRTLARVMPQSNDQGPDLPFGFGPGGDLPGQGAPQLAQGLGSGFVWDDQGHIVTNNHVVAGAEQLTVVFYDGLSLRAEVVGTDPESDLAVVKVDPTKVDLQPVTVGNSTDVRVGQFVVAIGNPFGLDATMTFGIVSALGRTLPVGDATMGTAFGSTYTIPDIIQVDAPVNPGNSGGALLDLEGRLIGVPSAIESPVRASAGVGFAIPSVIVQKVVPELITNGSFEHPYLGISGTTLTSELAAAMGLPESQRGALVVDITNDSPADKAGLRGSAKQVELQGQQVPVGGDVITAVDGQPVRDFEDVTTYLARNGRVGQDIALTVLRDGEETTVTVTLGARPKAQAPSTEQPRQTTARAWLGISGMTLSPDLAEAMNLDTNQEGVLIVNVVNNSPADDAGLRGGFRAFNLNGERIPIGGDVIVAVDGEPVASMQALAEVVGSSSPGDTLTLTILRDGAEQEVTVTLGEPTARP